MPVTFVEDRHLICMNSQLVSAASILLAVLTLQSFSVRGDSKTDSVAGKAPGTTVLVELFTSEGCSDCPPADTLLRKLDEAQPVSGVDLIVLSEHVDYWDYLGWRDPYSSHEYSNRQMLYSRHLDLQSVYTPQMVVDGESQFVGSDETQALRAIEKAARKMKVPVALDAVHRTAASLEVHLRADSLPASMAESAAGVMVAVADDMDESHVGAGENSGRSLKHIAVLRKLVPAGSISKTSRLDREMTISIDPGMSDHLRVVAFVQGSGPGRVLGAASVDVSK
jgi:hypothetical protein